MLDEIVIETKKPYPTGRDVVDDASAGLDEDFAVVRECRETQDVSKFSRYLESRYGSHNIFSSFVYPLLYEVASALIKKLSQVRR